MEDMDTSEDTDPFLIEFRTWQVRYGTVRPVVKS
jgi:hypothetical protein